MKEQKAFQETSVGVFASFYKPEKILQVVVAASGELVCAASLLAWQASYTTEWKSGLQNLHLRSSSPSEV